MILAGDYIPKKCRVDLGPFAGERILANLEGPITDSPNVSAVAKAGPALKSRQLSPLGTKFIFALANNHIMDYGVEGLNLTQRLLQEQSIPFCGAGQNQFDSRRPVIVEEAGKRIGILSCCERQFGISDISRPGCAEKGLWVVEAIRVLKQAVDYVIVSCHAASEFSPWPSPALRDFYRHLIDSGADIIHGHHAHVPQGFEAYKDGVIFYGLGNFVINTPDWGNDWDPYLWSLLAEVDFSGPTIRWTVHPCRTVCCQDELVVSPIRPSDIGRYMTYVDKANIVMNDESLFQGVWQETSVRLYHALYEQSLRTFGVEPFSLNVRDRVRKCYFAAIDIVTSVRGKEVSSARNMRYGHVRYNLANCESHVEVIRTALGVLTKNVTDYRSEQTRKLVDEMLVRLR